MGRGGVGRGRGKVWLEAVGEWLEEGRGRGMLEERVGEMEGERLGGIRERVVGTKVA